MKVAALFNPAGHWAREIVAQLSLHHEVAPITAGRDSHDAAAFHLDRIDGIHFPTALMRFRKMLNVNNPDLVLTLYAGYFGALAWASAFRPYAIYGVGSDIYDLKGPRATLGIHHLTRAACVLTNGESLADKARAIAPRANVVAAPHGIRADEFPFNPTRQATPSVLVTRGFAPVYNQQAIFDAVVRLPAEPRFAITFSSGQPGWAEFRSALYKARPDASEWVRFLGGVSPMKMAEEMGRHTHYLSMARHDGTSSALLEAMATGLWPIVSDTPANREWIEHGRNGQLIALDEPAGLLAAIANIPRVQGDDDTLRANREMVRQRADIGRNVREIALMLAAIGETNARPRRG